MRTTIACLSAVLIFALVAPAASAGGDYTCKGERIEQGSSTWGYARSAGSDYRIEKGSSSIAFARQRGSKWAIETFGSSTLGWLTGDRIEKPNGSTWGHLSDAKDMVKDCPDAVAAALWVLARTGRL
jgi:hypothetical protein